MDDGWVPDLIAEFSWDRVQRHQSKLLELLTQSRLKRHPLGFLHSTLMDNSNAALRLHIWKPGMRVIQEPAWLIHTHVFDLQSLVLIGSLKNVIYRWTPDTRSPEFRIYETSYRDRTSFIKATDRVGRIKLESSSEIRTGRQYSVAYGQFHQTEVQEDQFTATIALTKKYPGSSLVVGSLDGDTSHSFARSELTDDSQTQIVDEVARLLNRRYVDDA
jgi:hypothetical protein